eukprot:16434078-Heterocapsa_arctica.AAC.1
MSRYIGSVRHVNTCTGPRRPPGSSSAASRSVAWAARVCRACSSLLGLRAGGAPSQPCGVGRPLVPVVGSSPVAVHLPRLLLPSSQWPASVRRRSAGQWFGTARAISQLRMSWA